MAVYARYDGNKAYSYITPGKLYEVDHDDGEKFYIICDEDYTLFCVWEECAHLSGDNWTRIKED